MADLETTQFISIIHWQEELLTCNTLNDRQLLSEKMLDPAESFPVVDLSRPGHNNNILYQKDTGRAFHTKVDTWRDASRFLSHAFLKHHDR